MKSLTYSKASMSIFDCIIFTSSNIKTQARGQSVTSVLGAQGLPERLKA